MRPAEATIAVRRLVLNLPIVNYVVVRMEAYSGILLAPGRCSYSAFAIPEAYSASNPKASEGPFSGCTA